MEHKPRPGRPIAARTAGPGARPDGRKENALATKAALLAAGRRLFGELGYEGTSVGALCTAAGVTTGALYHHYGDKQGLFAAVAEALDATLVQLALRARSEAVARNLDGWQAFLAAVDSFLAGGVDRGARRIGLTDAAAVLGAERWQEIRERHGLGAMLRTVTDLQRARLIVGGDPMRLARLILGLLYGAVESLPESRAATRHALPELRAHVHAMLGALRHPAST